MRAEIKTKRTNKGAGSSAAWGRGARHAFNRRTQEAEAVSLSSSMPA